MLQIMKDAIFSAKIQILIGWLAIFTKNEIFWRILKLIDFEAQKYIVNTVFICFQFKMLGMFLRQFVAAVKLICKVGKIGLPLEL